MAYPIAMSLEIVEKHYHHNGNGVPFVVAIVDDTITNDTKLVIMFDEEDYCAVLSLDPIIESEDVSAETNGWVGKKYERLLRAHLWDIGDGDDDFDFEDDDE